ncbi:unnamed protein product [Clavelina lepadiformis]|uniref:SH2 domain-containing protein n=1 Tax=Clavelina lepadiformis TaxID=159417 RepID=A0ABP0GSC4_CLALP
MANRYDQDCGKSTQKTKTYHSGWIHVKLTAEDIYSKYFAQIKGEILYLFESEVKARQGVLHRKHAISLDDVYAVKKDMTKKALNRTPSYPTIAIIYNPQNNEVRIRASGAQEQEQWFRYIYVVAMGELPGNRDNMLPGQIKELQDIIDELKKHNYLDMNPETAAPPERTTSLAQTRQRKSSLTGIATQPLSKPAPFNKMHTMPIIRVGFQGSQTQADHRSGPSNLSRQTPRQETKPTEGNPDFHRSWLIEKEIGRTEAEHILETNQEHGNLLIRRRQLSNLHDNWGYAISVKEASGQFKHYKAKKITDRSTTRYQIALQSGNQPIVSSLDEVVDHFVAESQHFYRPLSNRHQPKESLYEDTISPTTNAQTTNNGDHVYENIGMDASYYNVPEN